MKKTPRVFSLFRKGGPQISNDAYRDGWDRIFGQPCTCNAGHVCEACEQRDFDEFCEVMETVERMFGDS